MRSNRIHSDQLYDWSAYQRLHCRFIASAPNLGQTIGRAGASHSPRLSHRAIQTVRQFWLQMPTRPRTRAQILPLSQPTRQSPRDGLRPRRIFPAGLRLLAELPASPSDTGEDLQYQPRVVTAKSKVLRTNAYGFPSFPVRSRLGRDPRCQLPAELVASRLCLTSSNSKPTDLP